MYYEIIEICCHIAKHAKQSTTRYVGSEDFVRFKHLLARE